MTPSDPTTCRAVALPAMVLVLMCLVLSVSCSVTGVPGDREKPAGGTAGHPPGFREESARLGRARRNQVFHGIPRRSVVRTHPGTASGRCAEGLPPCVAVLAHRSGSWLTVPGRGSPSTVSQDPERSGDLITLSFRR